MEKFEPNIQKDSGTDTEGYHTYQASIDNNQTYPVKYKVSTGVKMESMVYNSHNAHLSIVVRSTPQGGNFTVQIPKKIIDLLYGTSSYEVDSGAQCAEIGPRDNFKVIDTNSDFDTLQFSLWNYDADYVFIIHGEGTAFLPPLKQGWTIGNIGNIECNFGFQLIGKIEDGSPACVTSSTFTSLISLKWGYDPINEFTFEGINDTYKEGQPINNFVMKFKGMGVGLECDFPNVIINDASGKQVYQDAFGICSPPVNPPFKVHYYEHDWNGSSLAKMVLNKTGSYTIIVEMGGTGSRNFTVIQ